MCEKSGWKLFDCNRPLCQQKKGNGHPLQEAFLMPYVAFLYLVISQHVYAIFFMKICIGINLRSVLRIEVWISRHAAFDTVRPPRGFESRA
jgi:hypothetical protein